MRRGWIIVLGILLSGAVACQPGVVEVEEKWSKPLTLDYIESYADIDVPASAQDVRWDFPPTRDSTLSLYFTLSRAESESFITSTHAVKGGEPRIIPVGEVFLALGVPDRDPVLTTYYSREVVPPPQFVKGVRIYTSTGIGDQTRIYVVTNE